MMKLILLVAITLMSFNSYSQKYVVGDALSPNSSELELFSTSSIGIKSYRYKKHINNRIDGRVVGDIVVGIKDGLVVRTIYLIIPQNGDLGVPKDILNKVQEGLPFPLGYHNGTYGANIDNFTIMLSRDNSAITFNKDRIIYMMSIKTESLIKRNGMVLPDPAIGSSGAPIIPNTDLHSGSIPTSKKKQPPKGMTIEELSELHGPASTGFGSVPESVSSYELLKSKNSGNKYFKRPK